MFSQKYNPSISIGAGLMQHGGVVAYPTEAIWGLGCDPFNYSAVKRILSLKQREERKGLILVASSIKQFEPFLTDITEAQKKTLEASWPGPFTWLVPNNGKVPKWITGDFTSVALRVSGHPYVRHLCDAFGGPIVSTSANPQSKPAPSEAWQVYRYFYQNPLLDGILKGSTGSANQPSTITDLISGTIIR